MKYLILFIFIKQYKNCHMEFLNPKCTSWPYQNWGAIAIAPQMRNPDCYRSKWRIRSAITMIEILYILLLRDQGVAWDCGPRHWKFCTGAIWMPVVSASACALRLPLRDSTRRMSAKALLLRSRSQQQLRHSSSSFAAAAAAQQHFNLALECSILSARPSSRLCCAAAAFATAGSTSMRDASCCCAAAAAAS